MAVNKQLKNLSIVAQGGGLVVKPGDTSTRTITVKNGGSETAVVECWLEPVEERSTILRQWTEFDVPVTGFKVRAGKEKDVNLTFRIPLQAKHGFYSYSICIASDQYPGEDVRRSQQLQVQMLSSERLEFRDAPSVSVKPETNSDKPHPLKAGEKLTVELSITNPSRRTDLFTLYCLDLPSKWSSDIDYPERKNDSPGVIQQTEGLKLNPKESGVIKLHIYPTQYTPAGNYFPTLQVHSRNIEDLSIFEIIYLKIETNSKLDLQLTPKSKTLKNYSFRKEYFELKISNFGNIQRNLKIAPEDPDRIFRYELLPRQPVAILPGNETIVKIRPIPRSWIRRYFIRLRETKANFDVIIRNVREAEPQSFIRLDSVPKEFVGQETAQPQWRSPDLPEKQESGTIVLEPRGGWLLKLILTILCLGAVVGVFLLMWRYFFWKPSLRPRVITFESAETEYQEGKDTRLKFSFEVTNPEQIDQFVIYQGQQDQEQIKSFLVATNSQQVDNSQDTPTISRFSQLEQKIIDIKSEPSDELNPAPVTETDYCTLIESTDDKGLLQPLFNWYRKFLNWKNNSQSLNNTEQTLRCIDVPIRVELNGEATTNTVFIDGERSPSLVLPEGDYAFTLMVFEKSPDSNAVVDEPDPPQDSSATDGGANAEQANDVSSPNVVDTAFIREVTVGPPAPPEILEFAASSPEYRLSGDETPQSPAENQATTEVSNVEINTTEVNDDAGTDDTSAGDNSEGVEENVEAAVPEIESQEELPRFDSLTNRRNTNSQTSLVPIVLSWEISGATDIKELKLTSVSSEGTENIQPITYENFQWSPNSPSRDRFDSRLTSSGCLRNSLDQFICDEVKIPIAEAGDHTFTLEVVTDRDDVTENIVAQTSKVVVKAPSPEIIGFRVNGEEVLDKPKFVYSVNVARVSFDIELTWEVQHASIVELLPAPGIVTKEGLIYEISAAPGMETLTLRATNDSGEEVERSVVIEKVEFASGSDTNVQPSSNNGSSNGLQTPLPPPPPILPPPPTPIPFPVYPFEPETD